MLLSTKLENLFRTTQRKNKKCSQCGSNFSKYPPIIIFRESCECSRCGKFLFLEAGYAKSLEGKVLCEFPFADIDRL